VNFAKPKSLKSLMRTGLRRTWDFRISACFAWPYATFLFHSAAQAYKTAFVLSHKLREAMATEVKGYKLGGAGKTVEVDGAYFGGYVKPANHKENRRDRRLLKNQTGKRQCVVVIRQRDGFVMPSAFKTEGSALAYIRNHVAAGTEVHADEANSWNDLHGHYVVKRINHQLSYSDGIACTNGAESFFSRLRRAEVGHHHHIAGAYLARYAQESAYREGHRRDDNGKQVRGVVGLAMKARPSVDFCGYWQRVSSPNTVQLAPSSARQW